LGGGILLVYLSLFSWTHHELGKNWTGLLEIYKDHDLVVTVPYRLVRHPMYSAFFLSGIGVLFLSANWLISGLYLLAVSAMYYDRVLPEEAMMTERFGDAYREYMCRTGRLFPGLRKPSQ
jgi:protein-S-isoprenylcysteine O-methyltransferase Ste14